MNDIINELATTKENLKKELNNFSKEKEVELLTLKTSLEKDFQSILEGKTTILREFSNEQINSMKDLTVQALLAINDTAVDKEKELKMLETHINGLLLQTNDSLEQKINQAVNNFYNDMETTKNEIFQNILNNINTFKLDIDKKCENWLKQIEFSSNEGLRQLNVKENEAIKFIENAEQTALSNMNNLKLQLEKEITEKFNNIEQTILLELTKSLDSIKEQTRISIIKLENESAKFTLEINGIIETFNSGLNRVLIEQQQVFLSFIEEQKHIMIQIKDQMVIELNIAIGNTFERIDEKKLTILLEMDKHKDNHVATLLAEYNKHKTALTGEKTAHSTAMTEEKNTHVATLLAEYNKHKTALTGEKNTHSTLIPRVTTLETELPKKLAITTYTSDKTIVDNKISALETWKTTTDGKITTLETELPKKLAITTYTSDKTASDGKISILETWKESTVLKITEIEAELVKLENRILALETPI